MEVKQSEKDGKTLVKFHIYNEHIKRPDIAFDKN